MVKGLLTRSKTVTFGKVLVEASTDGHVRVTKEHNRLWNLTDRGLSILLDDIRPGERALEVVGELINARAPFDHLMSRKAFSNIGKIWYRNIDGTRLTLGPTRYRSECFAVSTSQLMFRSTLPGGGGAVQLGPFWEGTTSTSQLRLNFSADGRVGRVDEIIDHRPPR